MSIIKSRIDKLESIARDQKGADRVIGISPAEMAEIRRFALTCDSVEDLTAYLKGRSLSDNDNVAYLSDHHRTDAVLSAAARTIMDEVRAGTT